MVIDKLSTTVDHIDIFQVGQIMEVFIAQETDNGSLALHRRSKIMLKFSVMYQGFGWNTADVDACPAIHGVRLFNNRHPPARFCQGSCQRFTRFAKSNNNRLILMHALSPPGHCSFVELKYRGNQTREMYPERAYNC